MPQGDWPFTCAAWIPVYVVLEPNVSHTKERSGRVPTFELSLYRNAGMIEKDAMEMVFPPASVLLVTKYGMSLCCAVIPLVLYLLRGAVRRLIMIVVLPLITNIQLHLTQLYSVGIT